MANPELSFSCVAVGDATAVYKGGLSMLWRLLKVLLLLLALPVCVAMAQDEDGPIGGAPVYGEQEWDPPVGGEPVYGGQVEDQPVGGEPVYGEPAEDQPIGGDPLD